MIHEIISSKQLQSSSNQALHIKKQIFYALEKLNHIWCDFSLQQMKRHIGLTYYTSLQNTPNFPQYTYKTIWRFDIDQTKQIIKISVKIIDFEIGINKKNIFDVYNSMIPRFLVSLNKSQYSSINLGRKVGIDSQNQMMEVFYSPILMNLKVENKIQQISNDISNGILDLLFSNIVYHDKLNEKNMIQLFYFREIFESKRSNRNKSFEKLQNLNSQERITYQGRITNVQSLIKQHIYCGYSNFDKKQLRKIIHKLLVKGNEKQNQDSEQEIDIQENQQNITQTLPNIKNLYQVNLYEIERKKQLKKHSYIKKIQQSNHPNERYQICQPIKKIQQYQCKKQQKKQQQTHYSMVSIVKLKFQYVITIHSFQNQKIQSNHQNLKINNQNQENNPHNSNHSNNINSQDCSIPSEQNSNSQKSCLIISSSRKNSEQKPKENRYLNIDINKVQKIEQKDIVKKVLAKKISSKHASGRQSFKNQLNFIKYVRYQYCPYIARYYIQRNDNLQAKKQYSQFNRISSDQTFDNETVIYLDKYDYTFLHFMKNQGQQLPIMPIDFISRFLFQFASALQFLSQKNIIHRDLKPGNIMIDKNMHFRLIDFGSCSRIYDQKQNLPNNLRNRHRNENFQQVEQNLKTTLPFTQSYSELPEYLKSKISQIQFQKCMYFDVYSFGFILQRLKGYIQKDYNRSQHHQYWFFIEIDYLIIKCKQLNPYDRISPLEICIYLHLIRKILAQKEQIISFSQYQTFKKQSSMKFEDQSQLLYQLIGQN